MLIKLLMSRVVDFISLVLKNVDLKAHVKSLQERAAPQIP